MIEAPNVLEAPQILEALVISIPAATERREFQITQLKKLKIPYQLMDATILTPETAAEIVAVCKPWERPMMHTEVAALTSHKRAWQAVVDAGKPLLIMEDDADLSDTVPGVLKQLQPILNDQKIDCLTLETRIRKKRLGKIPLTTLDLGNNQTASIHKLVQDRSGLAAYVLTPAGAAKLLAKTNGKLGLADALVWTTYSLKTAQMVPALAAQADVGYHYGFKTPIYSYSFINREGHTPPPANLGYRWRRILGQIKLGWRVISHLHNSRRVDVPLQFGSKE